MTIAVGVLATDGVVLAADTQLTITNVWKGEGGKIMALARQKSPSGACAITGAASLYEYLHGLGDELTKDFTRGLDDADKESAYERFGIVVRRFYERHVIPFTVDTPDVAVLIAYQRGDETALWQSNRNALIEQYDHGAVGIGSFAATAWLSRVWKPGLDVPAAIVLASFAAAVAKDSVDGCGKYTQVLAVQGNHFHRIDQKLIDELDKLYDAYTSEIQPAQVMECFGEPLLTKPSLTLDSFKERIGEVIATLRSNTPERVKQWRLQRLERLKARQAAQSPKVQKPDPPPLPE